MAKAPNIIDVTEAVNRAGGRVESRPQANREEFVLYAPPHHFWTDSADGAAFVVIMWQKGDATGAADECRRALGVVAAGVTPMDL